MYFFIAKFEWYAGDLKKGPLSRLFFTKRKLKTCNQLETFFD